MRTGAHDALHALSIGTNDKHTSPAAAAAAAAARLVLGCCSTAWLMHVAELTPRGNVAL